MIKNQVSKNFDSWLTDCDNLAGYPIQTFALGLRQDYAAIRVGLEMHWSNGQTEGQVNQLKFIKRQMYGRAKFDWLRLRVIALT